jgi:hypothetical protein
MSVTLYASPTHKAVVFSYDENFIKGEFIHIEATNTDTGDVGSREAFNSGTFTLFYPFDFTGTDDVVVTDDDGNECKGTVEIT